MKTIEVVIDSGYAYALCDFHLDSFEFTKAARDLQHVNSTPKQHTYQLKHRPKTNGGVVIDTGYAYCILWLSFQHFEYQLQSK